MSQIYTCCCVGPTSTQDAAQAALELAGIPILPADHPDSVWATGLVLGEGEAVLTVQHPDVNAVHAAADAAGWVLRMHCPARSTMVPAPAPLDEMRRAIDELAARVGRLGGEG